jgi:hypothetical protein
VPSVFVTQEKSHVLSVVISVHKQVPHTVKVAPSARFSWLSSSRGQHTYTHTLPTTVFSGVLSIHSFPRPIYPPHIFVRAPSSCTNTSTLFTHLLLFVAHRNHTFHHDTR